MSFNFLIKFFLEKEKVKMGTLMDMALEIDENGEPSGNGMRRTKHRHLSCIDKELFDYPPQSEYYFIQMFYNMLHSTFIILSKLRLGQVVISILDYYMVKIENTLDFCKPEDYFNADEIIDRHKKLPVVDRPMAWIFFIPALISLRFFRFFLSIYCIILGIGEITAQDMQEKVAEFRRYYRSIRHYAVDAWTAEDREMIAKRKAWIWWRIYYRFYETFFMTKHLVEKHGPKSPVAPAAPDADADNGKSNGHDKQSEDQGQGSSDTDDDLNTNELLEKYAKEPDTLEADPDYKPNESEILEAKNASEDDDSEEENVEELKGECSANKQENNTEMENKENSTDVTNSEQCENDKCNDELSLTSAQMSDLESEIMSKILNYFKKNYNFPPPNDDNSNEIYYSPIGSPPEYGSIEDKEAYNNEQSNHNTDV
ncbi:uncharacterized protein Jabba isoform X3 [Chironomus tepperi]|uniref:uncharacterized protein Jabba isoform X3 n=1 Tax=Chironomus tepperi TaxID=113505 RepID=UPI00391F48E3